MDTNNLALKERPYAFDAVCMDEAAEAEILASRVVHRVNVILAIKTDE